MDDQRRSPGSPQPVGALRLCDLTDAELEIMAGLLVGVAQADEELTPEESGLLKHVATLVGRERFLAAASAAKPRFAGIDEKNLASLVQPVRSQAARELMFQTVRELAFGDGLVAQEGQLLEQLAKLWQVKWDIETIE